MRLFVAVDPPPQVAGHLAAAIEALREASPQLRWGAPEQWHLTLAFLGEVPEAWLPALTERLGRAAHRAAPMSLVLASAGSFPRQPAHGRVLWVGVTGDREPLAALATRCTAAARRSGIPVDPGPYRPHLTLARVRHPPVDLTEPVAALSTYVGSPWLVAELHLVRSYLGAQVRHERLASWRLGSPPGARPPVTRRRQ